MVLMCGAKKEMVQLNHFFRIRFKKGYKLTNFCMIFRESRLLSTSDTGLVDAWDASGAALRSTGTSATPTERRRSTSRREPAPGRAALDTHELTVTWWKRIHGMYIIYSM